MGGKTTSTNMHVCIACTFMVDVVGRQKTLPPPRKMRCQATTYIDMNVMDSLMDEYPK